MLRTRIEDPFRETYELRDSMLGEKLGLRLRTEYEDMVRSHDLRAPYGVIDPVTEHGHQKRIQDFQSYVLRSMLSYQATEGMENAEKKSEGVRTFRKAQKKVNEVARQSLAVDVPEAETRFGSKADLPAQKARVWMQSPIVDGSVDWIFGPRAYTLDPIEAVQGVNDSDREERVRFSLTRDLPLDLKSGLTYGASTTRVTARLMRELTPGLQAELFSMRGVNSARANMDRPEQAFKLQYGLRF